MQTHLVYRESKHSLFGPSSFGRAEACPASADPDAPRLKRLDTLYADEGTTAHILLAQCLNDGSAPFEWIGVPVMTESGVTLGSVDAEMCEFVAIAVDWVRDNLDDVETDVPLTLGTTGLHGTLDIRGRLKDDGTRVIADLKYGMNYVPENTPQIGLYALMCAPLEPTIAVLIQPRLPHPLRSFVWTETELKLLAVRVSDLLVKLEDKAFTYQAGDHCQYCDRASFCPMLHAVAKDAALAKILAVPESIEKVSAADIDEALKILPAVERWVKAVEASMSFYIMNGGSLEYAKAVMGRGSRDWKDGEAFKAFMKTLDLDPFDEPSLLSPAKAEKLVPKIQHGKLKALIESSPGKVKAVHISADGAPVVVGASLENKALALHAQRLLDKG